MFTVEVTARALAQLERAAQWWRVNRPAAPGAIADDFEAAIKLLARQPGIGARSTPQHFPELRRLHLERVRFHVYYEARPTKVVVLAFWHASRGTEPKL